MGRDFLYSPFLLFILCLQFGVTIQFTGHSFLKCRHQDLLDIGVLLLLETLSTIHLAPQNHHEA